MRSPFKQFRPRIFVFMEPSTFILLWIASKSQEMNFVRLSTNAMFGIRLSRFFIYDFSKLHFFRTIPLAFSNFPLYEAHTKENSKMLKEYFWKIVNLKNHRWKIEIIHISDRKSKNTSTKLLSTKFRDIPLKIKEYMKQSIISTWYKSLTLGREALGSKKSGTATNWGA